MAQVEEEESLDSPDMDTVNKLDVPIDTYPLKNLNGTYMSTPIQCYRLCECVVKLIATVHKLQERIDEIKQKRMGCVFFCSNNSFIL